MHEPKQREFTFEHLLIGELSRHCWAAGKPLDVTVSRGDIYGYDLVLHADGKTRFVQVKTRQAQAGVPGAHTAQCKVQMPQGAAVVMLLVCPTRRCIVDIRARLLQPGHGTAIHLGPGSSRPSVPHLLDLLFGFKPPALPSAAFELQPLRSAA